MSDKTQNDPFNVLGISKEFLAAAKLPYGGAMFTDMAERMQNLTQAQIAYGQTIMRANATLLSAWLDTKAARDAEDGPQARAERPSKAAHRPDVSAP
ncbi:hypothetical protein [Acidocella facilis]|uniref:hypothetical protein n=1 Tax=Acidocella facilis TaxID=525 RepID=UPI001F31698D|nr:hypothetical protein [Acidocella facilis]